MLDLVINDMAAHLGEFKPTHVTDCFTSSINRVVHGVFNAVGGGTDQLDLFVDVITHPPIKCFRLQSSEQISESSPASDRPGRCRRQPAIRIGKIRADSLQVTKKEIVQNLLLYSSHD